jgi:adenylosuccinate lyase
MPYKRNPMRTERITGLARHVLTLATDAGFTAATQWFERTLDDSANRRIALAEAYLTTDAVLLLVHNVAAGLVVRPGVIRQRLEHEMPFMATESILMHADRLKDEGGENDLVERIAGDDAFGMSADEVRSILDPARHIGRAPEQVDAFLAELGEVLAEAEAAAGSPPELRA